MLQIVIFDSRYSLPTLKAYFRKLSWTVVCNQSRVIPDVSSFICEQLEVDIDILLEISQRV